MTKFWNLPFGFVLIKTSADGPVDLLESLTRENAYLQRDNTTLEKRWSDRLDRFINSEVELSEAKKKIGSLECELNLFRRQNVGS